MVKVGRNDICPCGSGKKYKKCCGKNNVITVGHIIEKELEEIHKDIIQYAMTNYEDLIQDYVEEYYHDIQFPEEVAEIFHFYCTLFIVSNVEMDNGKTILVEYIDRYVHKQKRQQIKDIMKSWAKARPSISIVCEKDTNNYLKVEDFFTEEIMTLSVPEDLADISVGGMLLSIILPAGHEKWMTFTVGLDLMSDKTEKMTTKILRLLEETGLDSTEFVTSNFIELVSEFIYIEAELTATDVEWQSEAQFEVAQLLEEKISNYFSEDEIINLAFMLWQKFCDKKNPRIQKPILYVAAVIYLMDQMLPMGEGITQAGLAKDFNIPSSSISNKFKELEVILSEDINELESRLYGLDDGNFDDDLFFEDEEGPLHSKMAMEKELANITKLMEDQDFNSLEEANEFLNSHLIGGNIPINTNPSNEEKAQDLIYEAFEAKGSKRKKLAEKALELYPNTPDAYLILAETADDPIEVLMAGVAAGESDLGKNFIEENKGHFWLMFETRPFMRVKYQLAFQLHDRGETEKAIQHYKELLELNPGDNQGVRYDLFIAYIDKNRLEDAEALLQEYDETYTTAYAYNVALLEFLKNGPTKRAVQLLKKAKKQNPFVLDYLLEKKRLPLHEPLGYQPGDENDAIIYAEQYIPIWHDRKERTDWLKNI